MAHVHLSDVSGGVAWVICVVVTHLFVDGVENLGNGIFAFCLLTVHVLVAGTLVQVDASQSCSLLPTVMLLLHHEVEFCKGIVIHAVFVLVKLQRLQQPYHGDAALVF